MPPAVDPAPLTQPGSSVAQFLRDLAVSPTTLATLLLAWVALLLLGTQLPQVDAPLPLADGLSRSDLLALQAFGLNRLGTSVPLLLLSAVTAIVAVARALFPVPVRTLPRAVPLEPLLAALKKQGLRAHLRGPVLTVGAPRLGPLLLGTAAVLAVAAWIAHGNAPLPIWTDVALDQPEATWPAWTVDAGSLAPAVGRWVGHCKRVEARLECQAQVPGGRGEIHLDPGYSATLAGRDVAWVAAATGLTNLTSLRLRWLVDGRPWLLQLTTGEVGEASELAARLLPFATRNAGPLVVVQRAAGVSLLTSPQLAGPDAHPLAATVQFPDVARLQWTTPTLAPWLAGAALVLGLAGVVLAWLLPAVRIDRSAEGVRIHRCNRPRVLQKIVELGDAGPD
jgi:hypothetical protein